MSLMPWQKLTAMMTAKTVACAVETAAGLPASETVAVASVKEGLHGLLTASPRPRL
jgi:hypothetical protein